MQPLPLHPSHYEQLFRRKSTQSFSKQPYQWQEAVGGGLISCAERNIDLKQLCVRPTGGGKTLLFNVVAAHLKGVTIMISPLLSLGADQFRKLLQNTTADRSITAFHLDELKPSEVHKLLAGLKNLSPSKTVVLITSPQTLLSRAIAPILNYLIESNMIRFVVYDEIHLAAHFGSSFRQEFGHLKARFFHRLPPALPMLFMTATCTPSIRDSFECLIGTRINHVHWPSPMNMVSRKMAISFRYTTRPKTHVKKLLERDLKADPNLPNKVIIYSNGRGKIRAFADSLKEWFYGHKWLWYDPSLLAF